MNRYWDLWLDMAGLTKIQSVFACLTERTEPGLSGLLLMILLKNEVNIETILVPMILLIVGVKYMRRRRYGCFFR